MKVEARRVAEFLRDPGGIRVALLHGEDEGLVRARAGALTVAVAGVADDPFLVSWLSREDHGRLEEEASAIAMLGGRRVVRVRDVGEGLAAGVGRVMAGAGDSLVVLEAGGLPRRSKLLGLVEGAAAGAVVACYPEEGPALRGAIGGLLEGAGVRADGDALDWLRDHLGGDYASTRGEVEKLILYAGEGRRLDLDAVMACVGDQAVASLDDAVHAAVSGDVAGADRAMERAFAEGLSAVGLLRGMLMLLVRLQQARARVELGASAGEAVDGMRPPVFWKRKDAMVRAVAGWTVARLSSAMAEVRRAELACKQTGAPDGVIARRLVLGVARSGVRRG